MIERKTFDVKQGDEVAIAGGYSHSPYELSQVKKITPTGQIVLVNGKRFDPHGHEIGGSKWNSFSLHHVTPAIRADIARDKLKSYKWSEISDELAMQVATLLGLIEEPKSEPIRVIDEIDIHEVSSTEQGYEIGGEVIASHEEKEHE